MENPIRCFLAWPALLISGLILAAFGRGGAATAQVSAHFGDTNVRITDQGLNPIQTAQHATGEGVPLVGGFRQNVVPHGTNGVRGDGLAEWAVIFDDQTAALGFPSFQLGSQAFAKGNNFDSDGSPPPPNNTAGISTDIMSKINSPSLNIKISQPFVVSAGVETTFRSVDHDPVFWGARIWDVDGDLRVDARNANGDRITDGVALDDGSPVNLLLPIEVDKPEFPQERDDDRVKPTRVSLSVPGAVSGELDVSVSLLAQLVPDGAIHPPQGDRPLSAWSGIETHFFGHFHVIPVDKGTSSSDPFAPLLDKLPELIRAPLTGRLAPQYPYLPSDRYYEVPKVGGPARNVLGAGIPNGSPDGPWKFIMGFNDLFMRIDDFAGFGGPVQVIAEGINLGTFDDGDSLDFGAQLGHGVNEFELIRIPTPTPITDGMDPSVQLVFDHATAFFFVVPETSSALFLAIGAFAVFRRLRRRRVPFGASRPPPESVERKPTGGSDRHQQQRGGFGNGGDADR